MKAGTYVVLLEEKASPEQCVRKTRRTVHISNILTQRRTSVIMQLLMTCACKGMMPFVEEVLPAQWRSKTEEPAEQLRNMMAAQAFHHTALTWMSLTTEGFHEEVAALSCVERYFKNICSNT